MEAIIRPSKISGELSAISSKSAAHRILIAAAFSDKPTKICCHTISKDILATVNCLNALGADISYSDCVFYVTPTAFKFNNATLSCNESGTTLRLLIPIVSAIGGDWIFDMRGRLPERPLSPLKEELISHGISFENIDSNKLKVSGKLTAGTYRISGNVSSQFISGLLYGLLFIEGESTLEITGNIESKPYIDMTLDTLKSFGANIHQNGNIFKITGQKLSSVNEYSVEGDWSNSAFALCAAAISKSSITVSKINPSSLQGDSKILDILEKFGAKNKVCKDSVTVIGSDLTGIDIDAKNIPDLVPIISVVASGANGTTKITGASRLRIKESDRLKTTYEMLSDLGADIKLTDDGFIINGKKKLTGGTVNSYNDHRIAMSACIASLICENEVIIKNAEAVSKSYPDFYEDMKKLGLNIKTVN